MNILLTGANGFLGSALLDHLARSHHLITISRTELPVAPNQTHFLGRFNDSEDLKQLDGTPIDAVIHLAAVTGGCAETAGISVNVEGTLALMRCLIDRGCRKFINASSIAVPGIESIDFRPNEVPIPDDHPCLDRGGYGFSKFLMEEVTRYLHRQTPTIDVINLRLAAVYPDEAPPPKVVPGEIYEWAAGSITMLSRSEAVRAFTMAVEAEIKPDVRTLNAVSKTAWVEGDTPSVLRRWWGGSVDLTPMENTGIPTASLYRSDAIEREIGFVAA